MQKNLHKITPVGAAKGGEAWLIEAGEKNVLFETGYACSAPKMIENIEAALNGRPVDYILLTHSHYDHASGVPYVRRRWPEVRVYASAYAAYVFTRPTAKRVMSEMNESAARDNGFMTGTFTDEGLFVDVPLEDGESFTLGDMSFEVISAVGHTKCSVIYWCAGDDLLLSCETLGTAELGGVVSPSMLVGWRSAAEAIKKADALCAGRVLVPHLGLINPPESREYFKKALKGAENERDFVLSRHRAGQTDEEIVKALTEKFYVGVRRLYQPEEAFVTNTRISVPMIIREFESAE